MQTFAVVAVRLLGLWLIAGALPFLMFLAADAFEQRTIREGAWVADIVRQLAAVAPVVAGLGLLVLSRSIGGLLVAGVANDAPAPEGLTVRGFTQVGVFLLGLFALLNGVPTLVGMLMGGYSAQAQHWLYVALGVILILSCVQLGKSVDALRR
jgi:hypothetical protein